jgi:RNA polymerase sigma factor (sigma-70 family)
MQQHSDAQLLRGYARQRSEAAFGEIVARHADLVYSAALRQVDSPDLARDVAQTVFIDLARKARSLAEKLPPDTSLVGWLYRSTRFAALNLVRHGQRRQAKERQAMEHVETMNPTSEAALDWERVRPLLDEAISSLDEEDRDALLLRFFKNQDFRAVGLALGVSDDAAQKRVSRALDKLRDLLSHKGITTSGAALSVAISANAVQTAPVGLVATLSSAAIAATTVPHAAIAATKLIAMTTIQKAIIGAALVAAVGTGIHEARRASRLSDQLQTLQQEWDALAQRLQRLQHERDDATNRLAELQAETERLQSNQDHSELLKLRGEVARLQNELRQVTRAKTNGPSDPTEVAAQAWVERVRLLKERFAQWPGRPTPELALLSEQDWLKEAANRELDSDEAFRMTMRNLRANARGEFSVAVNQALDEFAESNNGQLPSELSQLKLLLKPPLDSILDGYEIAKPGWVHLPQADGEASQNAERWALILKGSFSPDGTAISDRSYLADPTYDATFIIYKGGCYGSAPMPRQY